MCGIAGFVAKDKIQEPDKQALQKMVNALEHRGPDAHVTWLGESGEVALGHTRLSILDLSDAGAQPMTSACGRYVLTYNGEVYNAPELRNDLETLYPFKGHSDTEVILAAIAEYGLEKALPKFNGMFAGGLWDKELHELSLFRDQLGKKPLFYAFTHHHLIFASELKSLRQGPQFLPSICQDALTSYMQFGYIPEPYCIYEDCFKLRPGHVLTFCMASFTVKTINSWWDPHRLYRQNDLDLSYSQTLDHTEMLLEDSIKLRLQADVPLGAFLSGGIDSSLICAMASKIHSQKFQTYSIGFENSAFDETSQAALTAQAIGSDHHKFIVTAKDALDIIPQIPQICDEPFADSSIIPTTLMARMARKNVTVALGGDGGDEVFCGYERYIWGAKIAEWKKKYPEFLLNSAASTIGAFSPRTWDSMHNLASRIIGRPLMSQPGDKAQKMSAALQTYGNSGLYKSLIHLWPEAWRIVKNSSEGIHMFTESSEWPSELHPIRQFMFCDVMMYLNDDILQKADRASMSTSLELRSPLLDHRLMEFAWSLPLKTLIGPEYNQKKRILKDLLLKHLPSYDFKQPKRGFAVPIQDWLRGDLKDWAGDLLNSETSRNYFHKTLLDKTFSEHLKGKANHQHRLWATLMFLQWADNEK